MNGAPFKVCTCCGFSWNHREGFLADPTVVPIGYQVDFTQLASGLFLFNHALPTCGTTIAVEVGQFADLYAGPLYEDRRTSTPACPRHCLYVGSLDACPAACECRSVRDILGIIRTWPKAPAETNGGRAESASGERRLRRTEGQWSRGD